MVGITAGGQATADAIRREAADLFSTHGYEATSLRQVAAKCGITVGSLYNHISSKEDLLLQIMGGTMDELTAQVAAAVESVEDPLERLVAFLSNHISFHAEQAQRVFIGNSELRSLPADLRAEITAKRRAYRRQVEELILEAAKAGQTEVVNARLHAYNIIAIGTDVATWYRPGGEFSLERIVKDYTEIILRSLGASAKAASH
ncbi:TetR/AcrR family transcriptional regulator [Nocardioides sp.]|jgi:AcrR family transcriptional regulator|uniref:TetR/AcrR family transcriptional regulator n=1 Tax=Nocardioides sp. TaxID=35761 RepID=UPI002CDD3463|nr:TetR/AcrR family transcriptional regulator [Nocardioides sp.]HVX55253.1 TetR/AcrR family transcriptional regulator [Nocardioides sp.]